MKLLLVVALCALSHALPYDDVLAKEWELFKVKHNRNYSGPEESFRLKVYMENKRKVEEHNAKFEQGLVTYTVKMNHFSDLLPSEVKERMNGYIMRASRPLGQTFQHEGVEADATVDWRQKGAVTPVKNQQQCGSCWAFSTTGSLEGQHFLKTGKLVSLSEQNLVDCSGNYGNMGCNGGLMDYAFQYIKANGGIDTEQSYPYTATDGRCEFKKSDVGATDAGYVDIPSGNEDALKKAVSSVGPVSVAIDASNWSFQMYSGGIYNEPSCSTSMLDHGVLAVGYGSENGQDYWIVKNSWGEEWGESGYLKMTRNKRNQCGIATQASYPTV